MLFRSGGSSEDSARSAARRGLGLQLPGLFAGAGFFRNLADIYRREFQAGRLGNGARRIGYTAHCHVGTDGDAARRDWEKYHIGYLNWVGDIAEAGGGPRGPRPSFERNVMDPEHHTALCGTPDEVTVRLERWRHTLGGQIGRAHV